MQIPSVSFVILNYKTKELVRECIGNIYRAGISYSFEILVVDNSRDSGLEELLGQRYPHVRYIPLAYNIGCAAGNNVGIKAAKGEYIVISNADVTLLPGTIDKLCDYLQNHSNVGIIGPRFLNPDGSIQESCYRFYRPLTPIYRRLWVGRLPFARKHIETFLMKDAIINGPADVDSLMGAFLVVQRSALQKVGLFDERFFLYFSDTDWCMRFWKNGYRVVYHSSAELIHLHKRQSAQRMGLHSIRDTATRVHILDGLRYFLKYRMKYARP